MRDESTRRKFSRSSLYLEYCFQGDLRGEVLEGLALMAHTSKEAQSLIEAFSYFSVGILEGHALGKTEATDKRQLPSYVDIAI